MNLDKLLCQVSIKAYGDKTELPKNFTNLKEFDLGHIDALTGEIDGIRTFAFRGTDDWKDTMDDLQFWRVSSPKDWFGQSFGIHSGFKEQTEVLIELVYAYLGNAKSVYLTGHSLGGAITTLFAGHMAHHGIDVLNVVTFGAPRVSTKKFARWYWEQDRIKRSVRYYHQDDPVPRIPYTWMGYCHVPEEVRIDEIKSWKHKLLNPIDTLIGDVTDHDKKSYYLWFEGK